METKILTVNFDIPIYSRQIKHFRSAIIQYIIKIEGKFKSSGMCTDFFLNRIIDSGPNHNVYRYPLIQYQISERKASITGINAGADVLLFLLDNAPPYLNFDGENFDFIIENISEQNINIETQKNPISYRMFKWIALNDNNFRIWQNEDKLTTRVELLESCLYGHIKNFLVGIGKDDLKFETFLRSISMESWANIKDTRKKAFDITFVCNLNLPDNICIGQHAAYGFGKIRPLDKPTH